MKMRGRISIAGLAAVLMFPHSSIIAQSAEATDPHQTSGPEPDDPVLKEQISKITKLLDQTNQQRAQKSGALKTASDPSRKAALTAELEALRKDHDMLEKLLHDLVNETASTEQTKVDEALQRVKRFEERQELEQRQEEAVRDRQDQEKQEQE